MSRFFTPYEGSRPYLFISYSHRDSEAVLDTITLLHDKKLRLWYDEGIPAGSDWPKNIEAHMRGCAAVLFFCSAGSMASLNCHSEIRTALALKKPVLFLRLDGTKPAENWEKLLSRAVPLSAEDSPQHRAEAVLSCKRLGRGFYRRPGENINSGWVPLVLSALFLLLSIGGLYALVSGRFLPELPDVEPTPVVVSAPVETPALDMSEWEGYFPVSFPDSQQERAVRTALGEAEREILRSDLLQITSLTFCGNMTLRDPSGVAFDSQGRCTVNGAPVGSGSVRELSEFGSMPYLESLALVCQPVEDLSALNGLLLLRELDLAGCQAADLSSLNDLPALETLHLEHSAIRELSALSAFPALRTVTVSADMLPLDWAADAPFEVILVP